MNYAVAKGALVAAMNDEDQWELDEQFEYEQLSEYRRGLELFQEASPEQSIVEDCPWCVSGEYCFDLLGSWCCDSCGYYPGAELSGGRFS